MRYLLFNPAVFLLLLWGFILGGFYLGPFDLSPQPAFKTLSFVFVCLSLFVLSSLASYSLVRTLPQNRHREIGVPRAPVLPIGSALSGLAVTSIIGVALIFVERTSSTGFSGLEELTELRNLRAADIASAAELSRGWATYLGWLLYPGIYLVCVLGFLYYETLDRGAKVLLLLSGLCPFVLAVLYGGRSPILTLLLLLASSSVVRRLIGKPLWPRSAALKLFGVAALVMFTIYANLIWFERLQLSSGTVDLFLAHAASEWGIAPSEALWNLLAGSDQQDAIVPILGSYFYLFQGPAILEKILSSESLPILFGGQHIDIVAAAFLLFEPTRELLTEGYATLLNAGVYGYFTTAWGSLLLDLSVLMFPFVALWGWVSGTTFGWLRVRGRCDDVLLYVFLLYAMFISPISAPFGLANSFSIFLYFLGFVVWVRTRACRNLRRVATSVMNFGSTEPSGG
jgi:hypothetical protein